MFFRLSADCLSCVRPHPQKHGRFGAGYVSNAWLRGELSTAGAGSGGAIMLSPTNYPAADSDCSRGGGSPSSLEAASSQTWASCRKDTRTSSACASRAHLKHSSAIARYSAAVFMKRCAFPRQQDLLQVFPNLSALSPIQQKNYELGS